MTAAYPSLLVKGLTNEGRFDPFDLYAGDGPGDTQAFQAADGQAIQQFQVVALDANGRVVPFSTSGFYASQTITVASQPSNNDTLTVNGTALTFKSSLTGASHEILIGGTTADTATNTAAAINADVSTFRMTASVASNVVTVMATVIGTAGNALTLAKSGTNPTLGAGTLAGASATGAVPNNRPFGVAMQPADAATPGNWLPIMVEGDFNHEALVWPTGFTSLAARKAVFVGTPVTVNQLL